MDDFDFDDIKERVKTCDSVWKRELDLLIAEVERLREDADLSLQRIEDLAEERDKWRSKFDRLTTSIVFKEKA